MSALITQSGCALELSLLTTTSKCKCKKTYTTSLLWELNVLKVGQSWSKLVKIVKFHDFLRFLRFLTNFIILYNGQHFLLFDIKHNLTQSKSLAKNTDFQGSKVSLGVSSSASPIW